MSGIYSVRATASAGHADRCQNSRSEGSLGIGEADWAFKVSFEASDWELSAPNVDLVFDGLDTFSVITLVRRSFADTGSPLREN